jgi:heme exporter protein A
MITVSALCRSFGPIKAVDGLSLDLQRGQSLALFGPNGAGKTTLIRLLTLCLRPSSGSIRIDGLDPGTEDLEIRRRIGLISHQSFLYEDLTARQNLEFFCRLYGVADPRRRAEQLLESVELQHRADDAVRTFSRGMQQRLSLVRALVHKPRIIFLDEPFTGLDPRASGSFSETVVRLRAEGRTVVMATHDLVRGLELSDRWAVMNRGSIAERGSSKDTHADDLEGLGLWRSP